MKVLVIGQGGREHSLAWKIKESGRVKELYCAPGNAGMAAIATNVPIKSDDLTGLCSFCEEKKIDITLVGPEIPLTLGIVDIFSERGLKIFGPTKSASQLEASKIFTKELCEKENIPTAAFEVFNNAKKAKDFVQFQGTPIVIKADGLAAGKGVIVAENENEAFTAIDKIMTERVFGSSGDRIILEECLEGEEASIIVVSDGENIVPLASSQDHKRVFDCDKGPNTGGMGAYSPTPAVTDEIFKTTLSRIIKPAVMGMKESGSPHKGVLYAGIMITSEGPKLLEFNVRFGDPETQAILPRLESDFLDLVEATVNRSLKGYTLRWSGKSCVCVVVASGGYPGSYENGKEISGIENALRMEDTFIFHAGTKIEKQNGTQKLVTDGGRVLNVVTLGEDIKSSKEKANRACEMIRFDGMHYRKDIGYRAIGKIKGKQEVS